MLDAAAAEDPRVTMLPDGPKKVTALQAALAALQSDSKAAAAASRASRPFGRKSCRYFDISYRGRRRQNRPQGGRYASGGGRQPGSVDSPGRGGSVILSGDGIISNRMTDMLGLMHRSGGKPPPPLAEGLCACPGVTCAYREFGALLKTSSTLSIPSATPRPPPRATTSYPSSPPRSTSKPPRTISTLCSSPPTRSFSTSLVRRSTLSVKM